MAEEPRYTLAEAAHELRRRECANDGHDWDHLMNPASNDPFAIHCSRCGRMLHVVRGE